MDDEIIDTIWLSGFDPDGTVTIEIMRNGALQLCFEFMPPSDLEDKEDYFIQNFERQLSAAICLPVLWQDRELFVIDRPHKDTIERITAFLANYRKKYARELGLN